MPATFQLEPVQRDHVRTVVPTSDAEVAQERHERIIDPSLHVSAKPLRQCAKRASESPLPISNEGMLAIPHSSPQDLVRHNVAIRIQPPKLNHCAGRQTPQRLPGRWKGAACSRRLTFYRTSCRPLARCPHGAPHQPRYCRRPRVGGLGWTQR